MSKINPLIVLSLANKGFESLSPELQPRASRAMAASIPLIAAAPELLEACKAAEHALFGHPDTTPGWHELRRNAYSLVRAAIAKAEGGGE